MKQALQECTDDLNRLEEERDEIAMQQITTFRSAMNINYSRLSPNEIISLKRSNALKF